MPDTPASRSTSALRDLDVTGSSVGNYRITEELSTGGMGAVYRARHDLLGKPAAVKLLRPELCEYPEMVERFFNEARAATAIRHPGIVEVFDFGYHDDGRAYLVMEFLDGESLAARLATTRTSEVGAAVIARGIASALGAAHAKGIVHRDLKPDNIFLVPDPDMPSGERPKVLDFGIAKLTDAENRNIGRTRTGALMGTPQYMAPEQARAAAEIDGRADLYSLGCMLYEMLVGQPPFVAEGAGEIISLQLFAAPEPPGMRVADLSDDLERIVMKLLEKEPSKRFQSAAEVVEALSAAMPTLSGRLSAAIPATSGRRKAIVVPTASDLGLGLVPATTIGGQAALTPVPVGASAHRPRRRSLGPAILAGAATLAVAAAVIVFVIQRDKRASAPPTADPGPTPPVVVVTPPTHTAPDVTYHLAITPAGTPVEVEVDGVVVEMSRGFFTAPARPDRRLVTIRAQGFADASVILAGDASEHRQVALVPATGGTEAGVGERTTRKDRTRRQPGSEDPPDRVESTTGTAPLTTVHDPAATDPQPTKQLDTGAKVYTDILDDESKPKRDPDDTP